MLSQNNGEVQRIRIITMKCCLFPLIICALCWVPSPKPKEQFQRGFFYMINGYHLAVDVRCKNQQRDVVDRPMTEYMSTNKSTCEGIGKLETLESKPIIYAKFLHQPNCDAEQILRIRVEKVKETCLLVIGLAPELDVISSVPITAETEHEILGVPVVTIIDSSCGTWDICYPQSVFERDFYLPPDQRNIDGWNLQVFVARRIIARTLEFAQDSGRTQVIIPSELSQGLWVLAGPHDKQTFLNSNQFQIKEIAGGEAGVRFYVDNTSLITFEEKKFNVEFMEKPCDYPGKTKILDAR